MTFAVYSFKIIFEAVTESGYEGDIAIDDISIEDGECLADFNTVEVKPKTSGFSKSLQEQISKYRKLLRRRHRMRLNNARKEKQQSASKERINSNSKEKPNDTTKNTNN